MSKHTIIKAVDLKIDKFSELVLPDPRKSTVLKDLTMGISDEMADASSYAARNMAAELEKAIFDAPHTPSHMIVTPKEFEGMKAMFDKPKVSTSKLDGDYEYKVNFDYGLTKTQNSEPKDDFDFIEALKNL